MLTVEGLNVSYAGSTALNGVSLAVQAEELICVIGANGAGKTSLIRTIAGIVEGILHHMCAGLADGQNVKISGFGSFILRDKGERVGRNPKTGIEVPIAPRRVLTFRASQMMRDRIVAGG